MLSEMFSVHILQRKLLFSVAYVYVLNLFCINVFYGS